MKLPESRTDTTLRVFEGEGHCLQDDNPGGEPGPQRSGSLGCEMRQRHNLNI